jgi:hypothetical protein
MSRHVFNNKSLLPDVTKLGLSVDFVSINFENRQDTNVCWRQKNKKWLQKIYTFGELFTALPLL